MPERVATPMPAIKLLFLCYAKSKVRIHSELRHRNVVELCDWYKTSHHTGLILEHCVGGDLLTILQQLHKDSMLSEESIHDLAYDMVKALQFLHSKGIIHCNIKPSNILFDEYGCAKLCDFGSAKELKNISTHSSSVPLAKRGTPCYMAPELFEDVGIYSYASDLWALGCVLYECFARRPPFMAREYNNIKSILSDPIPPLCGHPSQHFVDLINSLLVKNPAERIQWPELCAHPFWRREIPPVALPAFDFNENAENAENAEDEAAQPEDMANLDFNENSENAEDEAHAVITVSIPSHQDQRQDQRQDQGQDQRQDQRRHTEESLPLFLVKFFIRGMIEGIFQIAGQVIGSMSPKNDYRPRILRDILFTISGFVWLLPSEFIKYALKDQNAREKKRKFSYGILALMTGRLLMTGCLLSLSVLISALL
ncbi:serine/threonine-protein kinase RUNKEL-like isoform X3 [Vigna angularis]|uniref:serine/threonine-protein kinase RUNKEL-like isoform X3 n=1 Tax=Phaseolus angularis TaxID=3914 RepID=UPI0022B47C06|nr:serine/threonine-protein kinase RUNKEL-like isoform X3 [Vigna angularis]